jgi:hypothetical protein
VAYHNDSKEETDEGHDRQTHQDDERHVDSVVEFFFPTGRKHQLGKRHKDRRCLFTI